MPPVMVEQVSVFYLSGVGTMTRKHLLTIVALVCIPSVLLAQPTIHTLVVHADAAKDTISKYIYGQFRRNTLGTASTGGSGWERTAPFNGHTRHTQRYCCCAEEDTSACNSMARGMFCGRISLEGRHRPRADRPKMVNSNWGGVTEDNSFGTHEFMDLCDQLGCEPVIWETSGSGTVKEMAEWVQYLTSGGDNPHDRTARERQEKPWRVKFWCVGNETWGCGGIMSADHYANELGRYSFFP